MKQSLWTLSFIAAAQAIQINGNTNQGQMLAETEETGDFLQPCVMEPYNCYDDEGVHDDEDVHDDDDQADLFCPTEPYGKECCIEMANERGLTEGGCGYEFSGDYTNKGCYTYEYGECEGHVFYSFI